ncbi:MAG: DUF2179 domain-containing protein [Bacteroidetes bacterium]|nr:DUF2179 domain-containing protein [Bacteroidota bacterium]
MDHFFIETLGLSENTFAYVLLPILIFMARICEVSVNTIRLIYMLGGRRYTSTIMGFFEALIWLIAMRQIFQHLDNWVCYVAYPGGFAAGIFVGMIIEERIAYGKVIIRIISHKDVTLLIEYMVKERFRYTLLDAEGHAGRGKLVFTVLPRERLEDLLKMLKSILPSAFYTIQNVKAASESGVLPEETSSFQLFTWLRGVIRN